MRRKKSTAYKVLVQASRFRCLSFTPWTEREREEKQREREICGSGNKSKEGNSFSRRLSREMGSH